MTWDGKDRRTEPRDYEARIMSKAELCDAFRDVGKDLISEFWRGVGIDVSKQDEVNRLRDNLAWVGDVRRMSSVTASAAVRVAVGAFATAVVASLAVAWQYIKIRVTAGGP